MRWFWIDRFEKFVAGQEAVSIKNVTLSEEPLDDYLPGYPHYPHALIIEGMAQTGGILVAQLEQFRTKVVLAKVSKADFHDIARPGDQLRISVRLLGCQPEGAFIEGTVDVSGKRLAELELTFAILDDSFGTEPFFVPGDFCRILRTLMLFDVGVNPDGTPIEIPQEMLDEESEMLKSIVI